MERKSRLCSGFPASGRRDLNSGPLVPQTPPLQFAPSQTLDLEVERGVDWVARFPRFAERVLVARPVDAVRVDIGVVGKKRGPRGADCERAVLWNAATRLDKLSGSAVFPLA